MEYCELVICIGKCVLSAVTFINAFSIFLTIGDVINIR